MQAANAAIAIQLALDLLERGATLTAAIRKAEAEGRDLSGEELDALAAADDLARQRLVDAIAARRASDAEAAAG